MSQPVSCEARRTFWPRRPMASDSCSSGTTTSMRSASSSSTTLATSAGCSALTMKVAGDGDQGMMSIFSPCSSPTTACTRLPRIPTQAPTGSMEESLEITAILARLNRIAGDRADLDDAVVDFRHFHGEQLDHELRMGARQEDLRAALLAAHVIDIGAHAVAITEGFARDQFVAADDAFAAAEIDDDIAVFDALDGAVDDLADAILEFVVLAVALGFAHFLHDHLLGRLGGDTAEIDRRQRVGDKIAELGIRVAVAGQRQRDLQGVVLGVIDNLEQTLQADLAGLGIDVGADVGFRSVARACGLLDRIGHGGDDDLAVNGLLARDRVGDLKKLKPVCTDCHVCLHMWDRGLRPCSGLGPSSGPDQRHRDGCPKILFRFRPNRPSRAFRAVTAVILVCRPGGLRGLVGAQ
jgi:hypothetical protein